MLKYRIRSFRTRIMMLSVFISGSVLIAFGISGWLLIFKLGLHAVDQEIRDLGHRELSRFHPPEHWENLEHALQFVYGKKPGSVVLLLQTRQGRMIYQSPQWPEEIRADQIPVPELLDTSYVSKPPPMRKDEFFRDPDPRRPPLMQRQPPVEQMMLMAKNFRIVEGNGRRWRIGSMGTPALTMAVCVDLEDLFSEMNTIRNSFLAVLPISLLLIAAGGWLIAKRALKPVSLLTETTEKITVLGLDQRVPAEKTDVEFARLIAVFNAMLDRLERSFQQAVRFSADAAHELKTPIAIIQGELEQAVQSAEPDSDIQRTFSGLLEETSRLKSIIQKLLLLARADAGKLPLTKINLDFSQMVESALEDAGVMDEELTIHADVAPNVKVEGDPHLLELLLQNLLGNAVKHNVAHGFIRLTLKTAGGFAVLEVENSGQAISEEDREKIFERFYRPVSQTEKPDGFGLGLSLAWEIAAAHRGTVELTSRGPETVRFRVMLPVTF